MTTLPRYLGYNTPAVCIQFDDALESHYTEAFAYMNPLGMKASCYIIPPPYRQLTEAQMIEMDAAGWDMCNHTTSPVILSTLSLEDQEAAISGGKAHLDGLGLSRCSSHVTYPTGGYNADTLTVMANLGMLTGKTVVIQGREKMYYHAANPYIWLIDSYYSSKTVASWIDYMEAAQKSNQVVCILFHGIVESGATGIITNRADFRTIIDWIHASGMPVLTVSQLWALTLGSIEI